MLGIIIRGLIAFWLGFALAATFSIIARAYADPPARFDHPNKNVVVQWVARDQIYRFCNNDYGAIGCARPWIKPCLIFAVHYNEWSDARLLRHEVAHCNGWPANHPL